MVRCRIRKPFTILELLVVLSIIGLLAGLLFPALGKAKERAKYTRWLSTNNHMNSDPATVVNYNFENTDFKLNYQKLYLPAVYNSATACESTGFVQADYHGILRNDPQWKRGGRWKSKTSLQFDGRSTYVEIPGTSSIDFNVAKDDFTMSAWIKLDNLTGTQTFFGKCELNLSSQYDLFLNGSRKRFETAVGRGTAAWTAPAPVADQWYNVALTSESGNYQIYVNGKAMTGRTTSGTNSSNNAQSPTKKLLLGAASVTGNRLNYYFMGKMDEFILSKRLWTPSEINSVYEMGAP